MATMAEWYDWWAELRPGVAVPQLWWNFNFTAPYHGHGVADSHAGIFSHCQMLSRRQKTGPGQATSFGTGSGPENAKEIAALMKEMKNTAPIILTNIERPEYRNDLFPLETVTIKKHFQFRFVRVEQTTLSLSAEGKGEAKTIVTAVTVEYRLRSSDEEVVEGDQWKRDSEFFREKDTCVSPATWL